MSIESFTKMMRETAPKTPSLGGPIFVPQKMSLIVNGEVYKPGDYICRVSDKGVLKITKTRVIRCRECKFSEDGQSYTGLMSCYHPCQIEECSDPINVTPDGFCACGEPE